MKKLLFVMNPFAGTRRANRVLAEVLSVFNRAGYEVMTYMTAGQGDATREVQARAAEVDLVVCVGGDGTFNETITGVLRSGRDLPVGYLPAGSTNDVAASLHLPTDLLQAARDIVEGEPCCYDVGKFGNRYFS